MKRFLPILLIAVAVVAAAVYYLRKTNGVPENEIRLSGNIELTQVSVAFKYPGRVLTIDVEEGATVRKGQVLARADRESLERQRDREQAGVTAASAQLDQLQTAIAWQKGRPCRRN
jgi:HlyD family secretion protein